MKSINRTAIAASGAILSLIMLISSCGTEVRGSATTVVPVGPTDFATIPPAQSTLPVVSTTLPPGSVGVEQEYIVRAGDSPIGVANLFGITVSELLSWNGLVAATQFPYPGATMKIPPTAMVNNPVITIAPNVSIAPSTPGCDPRPAGTYKVAADDSIYIIRKKFCVSLSALLGANGWPSSSVIIHPGQLINIPASGT
ncbi:MAG: LysM peptidoglycan-binding domain-containing protein [Ilumatobacteraceae bacterium]